MLFWGRGELTALSLSSLFHACAGTDAASRRAALIPAEMNILKMMLLVDREEEEVCLSEVFWISYRLGDKLAFIPRGRGYLRSWTEGPDSSCGSHNHDKVFVKTPLCLLRYLLPLFPCYP